MSWGVVGEAGRIERRREGFDSSSISLCSDAHSQKDGVAGGSKAAASGGNKDPVTVALNSNDPLYKEIRDLHLEALGQTLNEKCVCACVRVGLASLLCACVSVRPSVRRCSCPDHHPVHQ